MHKPQLIILKIGNDVIKKLNDEMFYILLMFKSNFHKPFAWVADSVTTNSFKGMILHKQLLLGDIKFSWTFKERA